jgi:hypothetical protein
MNKLKQIYHSKWFPRIFYIKPDGGKNSGVTAYFLIEWKILFSIGILHFKKGTREAYHNHAFNALTWWLKGSVTEHRVSGLKYPFKASFKPKVTKRDNIHKVEAHTKTFALTVRGPWKDTWLEYYDKGDYLYKMFTHGRKLVTCQYRNKVEFN